MSQLRKSLDKETPPHAVVLAGALAGIAEITSTYPLDTIKTQMQVNPGLKGIVPTGVHIIKTGGAHALYYGLPASIAQVGGKVALRFTAFDRLKVLFKDSKSGKISPMGNLAAGTAAGALEAIIWTSPTERIKVLQQTMATSKDAGKYSTTLGTIKTVLAESGVKGLYVGTVPTIWKQSASVGTRFWLYEVAKKEMTAEGGTPAAWKTMVAGGVVGGVSTVFNHPFDVIKSRMQAHQGKSSESPYKGTFSGLVHIAKTDGTMALMKGLSPRFTRVAFAQAITFTVYEAFLSWYAEPSSKDVQKRLGKRIVKLEDRIHELEGLVQTKDVRIESLIRNEGMVVELEKIMQMKDERWEKFLQGRVVTN